MTYNVFSGTLNPTHLLTYLGWGLPPCQVPASSIQPFGRNKHGPKIWGALPPFWVGERGPHLTQKSTGLRPTSIPSEILIHAAIWPQQIWAKNWGAGSPPNTMLHAKFHLDPSNRLATVHQRYTDRQTGQPDRQDRQRTDSIGRTVLQTVAQKSKKIVICHQRFDGSSRKLVFGYTLTPLNVLTVKNLKI